VNGDAKPEAAPTKTPPAAAKPAPIGFAQFLENMPPAQIAAVSNFWKVRKSAEGRWYELTVPELTLHCRDDLCNGLRVFRFDQGNRTVSGGTTFINTYLTYRCSNCQNTTKVFSLYAAFDDEPFELGNGKCYKYGELPPYGTPTSNRLLKLFGKDAEIFLKGRQCENHALGIGAFGYYRRVVESHKDQIFSEIIKVTEKIAHDLVPGLEAAKQEHQFLKAIESVKDAIPQGLLINGHNPLTLLHSALSEGLHAQTDEQCLGAAQDVRIVLTALVERLCEALKDEAELNAAIKRLAKRKGSC
jgi:hypothetical protein